ncbi:kelch-like protein 35 [Pygocentrus nattereri]|uniref:BTB domain-containing protein n=1 Tax=Pygocentrus nattereri TaxID=42514 RepID=A0A3B4E2N9_PYGNA|nr:kelch-like protein 35 [Pygocentrus nattereri]
MGLGSESDSWSDSSSEDSFCSGSCHAEHILQVLNAFRQSATFTDVVLLVEGREFPCHRATLCASSRYFRSMFTGQMRESRQAVVPLKEVSAAAMEHLLDFIYEGRVRLQEESVDRVYRAADLLDVPALSRACVDFLEQRVCPSNCLGLIDFAQLYSIEPLLERCQGVLYQDFEMVSKQEEFLELPLERVLKLLDSEKLQVQEEVLVEVALRWVYHRQNQRAAALKTLLERLQLPLLDPVFFTDRLETDELVRECRECWPLLQEARQYHMYGREVSSERTKPRRRSGWAEMIVVIGGCDRSGISRLSFAEKLDPISKKWLPSATLPGYSKCEFAVCELQNDIYLSGGQLNSSDVWRFMSPLNQWVRVGGLLKGRWRHKMVSLRGKLYAVGGYNGHQRLNSVECFSMFENAWKAVAPLLLAVSSAAVVSCAGKLYVIGGAVSEECNTDKVQCYDPMKDQWTYVLSCPFSQRCINAVSLNGSIYVAGGLLDVIYCYTPLKNTWDKVAYLPMKVESCGVTVCNEKVYVVGGRDEFAAAVDHMWAFDPASCRVTEETPMTRNLSNHGCATITQHLEPK